MQVKAETAQIDIVITLTGSSRTFNVTVPGMSVVCYELQISHVMYSDMGSSTSAQPDEKA